MNKISKQILKYLPIIIVVTPAIFTYLSELLTNYNVKKILSKREDLIEIDNVLAKERRVVYKSKIKDIKDKKDFLVDKF